MARTATAGSTSRRALDRRLDAWRQLGAASQRPHGGWILAIRESIGMTAGELGHRTGVSESAVIRLEQSERGYHARLATLRRAADALDCDLVYALVPRRRLDDLVDQRAHRLARLDLARVDQTMLLEDQSASAEDPQARLESYAQALLARPGLWREPS
jgi:predicted DNA-binding mobile mystery protein A